MEAVLDAFFDGNRSSDLFGFYLILFLHGGRLLLRSFRVSVDVVAVDSIEVTLASVGAS